jgi:transcriptional regulator with XRE-family HTH domain
MARSVSPKVLRAYGTVLRDCRKTAGLSQGAMIKKAAQAGLEVPHRTFLSSLENGRQEPGLGTQIKLARAVGRRPSEMLRRVEEMVLPASERKRIDKSAAGRIDLGTETCPGCKTIYSVQVERVKTRERGKFKCRHCKQQLQSWLGKIRFIYEASSLPKGRQAK